MLQFDRIVIPITLECNFKCTYCMRNTSKITSVPPFSDTFIKYIETRNDDNTKAFIITGGEPLLEFDKIKYIFSFIKNTNIQKKIISNGSLLTNEIVEYLNRNNIELSLSHDGEETLHYRGVDVYSIPNILELVKQINYLSVSSTICSNVNADVINLINYHKNILGRSDFMFLMNTPENVEPSFNYTVHSESVHKAMNKIYNFYHTPILPNNSWKPFPIKLNVLPNGDVVTLDDLYYCGNVNMTTDEISHNILQINKDNIFCPNYDKCPIKLKCRMGYKYSVHRCKVEQLIQG